MIRILALSGSLRSASTNKAALRAASDLAPPDMAVDLYDGIGCLPHFNPDLDTHAPPLVVSAFRKLIGTHDGVLIAAPEYAHGLPGAFKNALDWLVGSTQFPGKPIALFNTAPRARHSQAQLRDILETMSGIIIEDASVTLDMRGRTPGAGEIAADLGLSAQIREALSRFAVAITANADRSSKCA